ncbi:Carbonic anhydrase [Mycolicibacterium fortuitum]|uniref:Carbonic anhydrase n=1 Tax=Mycolicibacterium fortuitum TaxID=1766 RepID=A0A0N7H7W5_MYCFO|nr:carbonic anhydrase [Mycolicibacterium fortuitum]ALI24559.1 Carbonic anhydrase [Mycolicibacterium fortuitum]
MYDLAEGVAQFQRDTFPAKADLFAHLATTHRPHTLFIGCSDARVVPELITGSEPGELFVIRTAGNLVPAYRRGGDGITASIEYAVSALGVTRIVVCGHSGCGAMTALAENHDLNAMPTTAEWLRQAGVSGTNTAELVHLNVRAQLQNLRSHPSVARGLAAHAVTLHGWVFDIGTGAINAVDDA